MRINRSLIIITIICTLLVGACKHNEHLHYYNFVTKDFMVNDLVAKINNDEHVMIVFIHGTILKYPSLRLFMHAYKDFKKYPQESFSQRYNRNLRLNTWYNTQTINELGLIPIDFVNISHHTQASRILAHVYQSIYQEVMPLDASHFHFYTFGWNGKLDQRKREDAAFKLYDQLIAEIKQLKQKIKPAKLVIEILAHSHGGNVALNLAKAEGTHKKRLAIDRLMLFGIPVQSETANYIGSSVFKKAYNIYSRGDTIQVLDIFSTDDDCSKRRFKDWPNLTQIEVSVNKFKPLHTELWFAGTRDNFIYRGSFPLCPLPLFVLSPLITSFIDHYLDGIKNLNLKVNVEKKSDNLSFTFHDADIHRNRKHHVIDVPTHNIMYTYHHPSFSRINSYAL